MAQRKLQNGDKIQFIRKSMHYDEGYSTIVYGDSQGNFGIRPLTYVEGIGEVVGKLIQGPSAVYQYIEGRDWVFVD